MKENSQEPGQNEYDTLHLDEDEAGHLKRVSQEILKWCELANRAALISTSCVTWTPTLEKVEISSPDFIKALLTLKCANSLRLSTTAILIGYYAGAATLLRAAFESLVYLHLFEDDPHEIRLWLKLELHPNLKPGEREKPRRDQFYRAKQSFIRRAPDEKREYELIDFLWNKTSRDIHSSVVGLAQAFGLDFRDFLPDEFWVALERAGDDWGFALDLLAWKAIDGKTWSLAKYGQTQHKEEVKLMLLGRYDEDEAGLLSEMALFLAHRLTDLVVSIFEVTNAGLKSDFETWHRQVKKA